MTRKKASGRKESNLSLRLVALVIAFLIWLLVTNNDDPVRTQLFSNIPVTILNEDSLGAIGKVVEPEGAGTVTLRVTERRSVLARLARTGSDFVVEADMEYMNDMDSVPLSVSCTNTNVTWDEIEMSPSYLKVKLEDKVEQAFPVSVSTSGTPASGYAVGQADVREGKTILIAGPKSLVDIINTVTAPVNVTAMSENAAVSAVLRITDKNGSVLTESQLSRLEIKDSNGALLKERNVTVRIRLWEVKNLPLRVATSGTVADGYYVSGITLVPDTVTLAGTSDAFEEIGRYLGVLQTVNVEGASESVTAEVDLTETIAQYSSLKLMDESAVEVSASVQIEKSGEKTFDYPISGLVLENQPENMKLSFYPELQIPINVRSVGGNLNTLRVEDIEASVDLADCAEEGIYELPVDITLPEGFRIGSAVTLTVGAGVPATEASEENETE